MKKIVIATLFTACTTSVFAEHAVVSFAGKKVTVEDTRASLIKKLGKPQYGDNSYSQWTVNGLSIYANYNQYGVNNFSVSQLKPTPVTVNVDGKVITLGKDSLRSTAAKIKSGCYDYTDGKQGSSYSYAVLSGAEGEYQVIFNITDDDFDLKTKVKRPINEVHISYDAICQ
jgi:hypothetical protein